ncbi:MAG: hypothetical protein GKR98_11270 [Boseongicola sp.]|nr:MAG: hypothetical protein GKR98_11270 [Boseongicola sp.]
MIRLYFAAFLVLMTSLSPAIALSCLRPDAVRLYEQARDSEHSYLIVRGRLDLSRPAKTPDPDNPLPTFNPANLDGGALTSETFGVVFDERVLVLATCLGPWCGSAEGIGGERIFAIRIEGDLHILDADPCGSYNVPWSKESEERLLECHRTGTCVAPEF